MRRVVVAFAIYVAVQGGFAAWRWHVWSYGADTGTFAQIASNAFAGFYNTSERGSHFAVHWSPILVTLYPLAALTHGGLALQFAQIVLVGGAAFPFYAFVRPYVAGGVAATLAIVALAYPPLVAVAFDEFHEIAFYPILVFALLWAIDANRRAWSIAFAVLLVLVREEALLVVAAFGVALALAALRSPASEPRGLLFFEPRERAPSLALGVALAATSLVVFAAYFGIVAPSLGGWTASHFYVYPFARGPRDVALAAFAQPLAVARAIATPGRATYLLEAFAPLLFVPLRSPWMWVALPALAIVVLSSDPSAWRMGDHYAALWAPWLLVATAHAVAIFSRARLTTAILAACALVLVAFDPAHPAHYVRAPYAHLDDARAAFASVPVDASAFTHDEWFAHLAGRRPALEHVWNEPDYAVLANDFPHAGTFLPFLRRQLERGCYVERARFGAVVVYRKTPAAAAPACRIAR